MKYITENIKSVLVIVIILVCGLISITWFKGKNLVVATDLYFPYQALNFLKQSFYDWSRASLGNIEPRNHAASIPYGGLVAIAEILNLPLVTSQQIWFYVLFVVSGLSMLYLALLITKYIAGYKNYIVGLLASLMYMFNPFFAVMAPNSPYLWQTYALLPLKLALFIKGLTERKGLKYIILVSFFWLLTSANTYGNPKYLLLDLAPLVLFFIYYFCFIAKDVIERKLAIRFTTALFLTLFVLSSYWLLPSAIGMKDVFKASKIGYLALGNRTRESTYVLDSSPPADSLRLWGFWGADTGYKGERYILWADSYKSPLLIIIGYLLPILILIPIISSRRKNKLLIFFYLLMILALVAMTGGIRGFDYINLWIVDHIPFFVDTFSLPYTIFGIYTTVAYSFLFAYGIGFVYSFLSQKKLVIVKYIFFGLSLFIFIGINAWPLWTGDIYTPQRPIIASNRYIVPHYYFDASEFITKQKLDYRVFSIPYSRLGYGVYNWKAGYNGSDISIGLLGNIIYGIAPTSLSINQILTDGKTNNGSDLIALLNSKYILFHKDTNWDFLYDHSWSTITTPKQYIKTLNNQVNLNLEKTFEQLSFYKIKNDLFLPHFYTPKTLIYTNQGLEALPKIVSKNDYNVRSAIYFNSSNKGKTVTVKNTPLLEFKNITPSKYRVRVHGASHIFPLVFSEGFHEGWKIYISTLKPALQNNQIAKYKILDGNINDQASSEELKSFIDNGLVSTLGDLREHEIKHIKWNPLTSSERTELDYIEKYSIDFISKNFQDTIQNNNLPSGSFYETWFKKPIEDNKNHLMANGYANSWLIDTTKICSIKDTCKKNSDGGYDFEMIVEFLPQRLFYIGLAISGLALAGCLSYLIWLWVRKRKGGIIFTRV